MSKKNNKKTCTSQTYSQIAKELGQGYDQYFNKIVKPEADKFLSQIKPAGKILDAGCGAGTHTLYFKEKGYHPSAIDISPGMVKLCRKKGLEAKVMDLENLEFRNNTFDGLWCHTSLIHFDKKEKIKKVLKKMAVILKPKSPLFVALREGHKNGWELYNEKPGTKRWFLYFQKGELKKYLPVSFKVTKENITPFKNRRFLNYHLILKK
ncbi:MAG: class I SAM-dependent methyltransferase [Patescibacteria group bacterium]|nr:class I SAM-dependent methyltransferase [Patescibacteria group bacterium]